MKINFVDLENQHQFLRNDIQQSINDILDNCDFVLGSKVRSFESAFAKYCSTNFAISVSSGTAAIRLALQSLDLSEKDEVIIPSNTFFATLEAVLQNNLKPVFVDINPETYCIDTSKIEQVITKKTKVIIPVHLYGQCANMDEINSLAKKYNLFIIEDASQAHGATFRGEKAGSLGDIGCFSFYPGKNLGACGDGGICVTNNEKYFKIISMLRNHGSEEKYVHQLIGDNNRLDTIQAAILLHKLKHLNSWNQSRRRIADHYISLLKNLNIKLPSCHHLNNHVYHLFVIECEKRDNLIHYLKDHGIATGIHYPIPLHLQKACSKLGYKENDFPITEKSCKKILSLPIYPELNVEEINYISKAIISFFSK